MRFTIRFADKIVGTLVILGLAALIFVIFMLGRNQRWFARDFQYKTYFSSAQGLSTNMAVQYKGFTIGNVKKITLAEDDNVEVLFTIFEEHNHRVRTGSMVEVQASPIGLGNSFIFHPGRGPEMLAEGDLIPEINSPEGRLLIESGIAETIVSSDGINNIINQANILLENANTLLETVNISLSGSPGSEDMPIAQIISNLEAATRSLAIQLNPILANIDSVTGRISDPSSSVMSILDSESPVYSDLVDSLESIAGILDNLEKTTNFLPSQLPSVMADLNAALRSAQDVLVSLTNNPLLRRGVPQRPETAPGGTSPRNLEF